MAQPVLLPPPIDAASDEAAQDTVTYINGLVMESYTRQVEYQVWDRAERNMNLFLYGKVQGNPAGIYRANKIQSACIANAAIQAASRPEFELVRRTTGEPPQYYFNPQNAPPVLLQQISATHPECVSPMADAMGNVQPPAPLPPQSAQMLQQLIFMAKQKSMATGMPQEIPDDVLVTVDDVTVPEALETAVNDKFDEADGADKYFQNCLYNNVFGQQGMIIGFDDEKQRHFFKNPEVVCLHVDVTKTDIPEAAYAIFDEFLGKYEALQLYPDMSEAIEEFASGGAPTLAGMIPYRLPYYWLQRYFYRQVVIIRTAWLRDQPYPLTPDDALAKGKVILAPVPASTQQEDEDATSPSTTPFSPNATANNVPAESGAAIVQSNPDGQTSADEHSGESSGSAAAGAGGDSETDTEGGSVDLDAGAGTTPGGDSSTQNQGAGNLTPPPPPIRQAFYLIGPDGLPDMTKGEITPNSPDWPIRRSIREIRIVAGRRYYDRECQRTDFPIALNVNIPVPFTPWGQGEPQRLEQLQYGHGNIVTDIVMNNEYRAFPPLFVPRDVAKDNPRLATRMYASAREVNLVDPAIYAKYNGKMVSTIETPANSPDHYKTVEMLDGLIDDVSDRSDALRGQSSSDITSGAQFARMNAAARTGVVFKGTNGEKMLRQVCRVMCGDIIMRISAEALAEMYPEYPVFVWYEIKRRWTKHYLFSDFKITTASGKGQLKQDEVASLLAARQAGVAISDETIMQRLGLDPDAEREKNLRAMTQKSRVEGFMQPQMGGAPGAPGAQPQPQMAPPQ